MSFRERLLSRLEAAGGGSGPTPLLPELSEAQFTQFEQYFDLLRHWNRRINLTSLSLETLSGQAIDRLFVEPLCAARFLDGNPLNVEEPRASGRPLSGPPDRIDSKLPPSDRRFLRWADLGSGGGSPAIPLKIACPSTHLTMVESRGRKVAFLREVVRELRLPDVEVASVRAEALPTIESYEAVTVRAVRLDDAFLAAVRSLLSRNGWLILFLPNMARLTFEGFDLVEALEVPNPASRIALLTKSVT